MRIFAYLRASTNKQDAERAKQALKELVASYNREISHYYIGGFKSQVQRNRN